MIRGINLIPSFAVQLFSAKSQEMLVKNVAAYCLRSEHSQYRRGIPGRSVEQENSDMTSSAVVLS